MLITIRVPDDTTKITYERQGDAEYPMQHLLTMGMIVRVEPDEPTMETKE